MVLLAATSPENPQDTFVPACSPGLGTGNLPSSDLCWVQVAPEPASLLGQVWTFQVCKCEQKKGGPQQMSQNRLPLNV